MATRKLFKKSYVKAVLTITIMYLILSIPATVAANSNSSKSALLLNSYHKNFRWVNGIVEAVHKGSLVIKEPQNFYKVDKKLAWLCIILFSAAIFIIITLHINLVKTKKTEMELLESEERYRLLFEYSPSAVMLHKNGVILYINNAGAKLFGTESPNELIGRKLLDFIHEQHRKQVKKRIMDIEEIGSILPPAQIKVVRLNNEINEAECISIPFPYKGKRMVLSVLSDITAWKKLKEAIELDKLKTEFLSNISHEFRTPLNLILSTLQLCEYRLRHVQDSERRQNMMKYFSIIKQNSLRLLKLVNNLIDTTEIQLGNLSLDMANHDIVKITKDITMLVSRMVRDRGISVEFDAEFDEKVIVCDDEKIERAILNLLSNAVKFSSPSGNISVSISARNGSVMISVADDGEGIPQCETKDVFNCFKSVDKSFTRSHEGSGIGLSIAKSLIEMHGGNISLESGSGKGCKFTIVLPDKVLEGDNETGCDNFQAKRKDYKDYIDKINTEFSDICDIKLLV